MKPQYLPEDQEIIDAYVRLLNHRQLELIRSGIQYGSYLHDNTTHSDIVNSILNDLMYKSIQQGLYMFIATRPYVILNPEDGIKRLIIAGGV